MSWFVPVGQVASGCGLQGAKQTSRQRRLLATWCDSSKKLLTPFPGAELAGTTVLEVPFLNIVEEEEEAVTLWAILDPTPSWDMMP